MSRYAVRLVGRLHELGKEPEGSDARLLAGAGFLGALLERVAELERDYGRAHVAIVVASSPAELTAAVGRMTAAFEELEEIHALAFEARGLLGLRASISDADTRRAAGGKV